MRKWYFYDLQTGLFTGRALLSEGGCVPPDGCGAIEWPGGEPLNVKARRVDLASGDVDSWQPDAPPGDEMRTWAWDEAAERWQPVPTQAATKLQRTVELKAAIAAQETAQARPLREMLLALAEGKAAPAQAVAKLSAVEADVAALRVELQTGERRA